MTSPLKGDALMLRKLCLQVSDLRDRVECIEAIVASRHDVAELRERVSALESKVDAFVLSGILDRVTTLEEQAGDRRRELDVLRDWLRKIDRPLGDDRGLASQAGQGGHEGAMPDESTSKTHATDTGGSEEPAPIADPELDRPRSEAAVKAAPGAASGGPPETAKWAPIAETDTPQDTGVHLQQRQATTPAPQRGPQTEAPVEQPRVEPPGASSGSGQAFNPALNTAPIEIRVGQRWRYNATNAPVVEVISVGEGDYPWGVCGPDGVFKVSRGWFSNATLISESRPTAASPGNSVPEPGVKPASLGADKQDCGKIEVRVGQRWAAELNRREWRVANRLPRGLWEIHGQKGEVLCVSAGWLTSLCTLISEPEPTPSERIQEATEGFGPPPPSAYTVGDAIGLKRPEPEPPLTKQEHARRVHELLGPPLPEPEPRLTRERLRYVEEWLAAHADIDSAIGPVAHLLRAIAEVKPEHWRALAEDVYDRDPPGCAELLGALRLLAEMGDGNG